MFDRRVLLTILVLLAASGVVLAAQTQTNSVPQMPQLPAMPNGTNSVTTAPPGSIPSIGDLMTVVDKATADQGKAKDWSTPLKLVIIFTGLAILPSLLVMMTSFTRIVIVLSFVRRALTVQTIPPNIAIMGLALFLTLFTMMPTLTQINTNAIQPYIADQINFQTASQKASDSLKEFMLRQCRPADLTLFVQMAKIERPNNPMDIGLHIVIPAFVISEFRTAFEMGCLLFIPFLLIDIVIASVLLSAGMMMLPPMMISLPLKLVLFILVDGWGLLAKSLSLSFR
ncbi:MAG: flagellar type III secretion system pore protein FliP [Sedimentisphaerales bacterium]|jgi:flagellar biosynthetic protein FliP